MDEIIEALFEREGFRMTDGRGTEMRVVTTTLDAACPVVTERPGEPMAFVEVDGDWPVMLAMPQTAALVERAAAPIGMLDCIVGRVGEALVLVAVDLGGVLADGMGGFWDAGTLAPAHPTDYVATADMAPAPLPLAA